ncbi:hypothetical protein ACFL2D_01815, partial [Patescibacteria group bacterium]
DQGAWGALSYGDDITIQDNTITGTTMGTGIYVNADTPNGDTLIDGNTITGEIIRDTSQGQPEPYRSSNAAIAVVNAACLAQGDGSGCDVQYDATISNNTYN